MTEKRFTIDELIDYVIEGWGRSDSYGTSLDNAVDFVTAFAREHDIKVDYDAVHKRWAERWRFSKEGKR